MKTKFSQMETREVNIDFTARQGPFTFRNHSFGIGGINHLPMPQKVIQGIKKLQPKLIRIFLQEFFFVYPDHNVFDWAKMDAYVESVHEMGADIMAHICIKPKPLYPVVDENVWEPTSVTEWQTLIKAMVCRYSIEKKYITHWAIANETNIGEWGGCPYLFDCPKEYFGYYKITAQAIVSAGANVKIGGPAWAGTGDNLAEFLDTFFALVKEENLPLDFISYNFYSNSPDVLVKESAYFKSLAEKFSPSLEVYITELNVGLGAVSEDEAHTGARAASLAATLIALSSQNLLNGTFQYHIVDQHCNMDDFAVFFERYRYMSEHWNDGPHKLGLFDWDGNPRPQYFMYELLYKMCGELVSTTADGDLYNVTTCTNDTVNILVCNFGPEEPTDYNVVLKLKNNPCGLFNYVVDRVDDIPRTKPVESRTVYMGEDFYCKIYAPAYSVTLVQISKS